MKPPPPEGFTFGKLCFPCHPSHLHAILVLVHQKRLGAQDLHALSSAVEIAYTNDDPPSSDLLQGIPLWYQLNRTSSAKFRFVIRKAYANYYTLTSALKEKDSICINYFVRIYTTIIFARFLLNLPFRLLLMFFMIGLFFYSRSTLGSFQLSAIGQTNKQLSIP